MSTNDVILGRKRHHTNSFTKVKPVLPSNRQKHRVVPDLISTAMVKSIERSMISEVDDEDGFGVSPNISKLSVDSPPITTTYKAESKHAQTGGFQHLTLKTCSVQTPNEIDICVQTTPTLTVRSSLTKRTLHTSRQMTAVITTAPPVTAASPKK